MTGVQTCALPISPVRAGPGPLGGSAFAGIARLFSSRYLGGIGLVVMLFAITSTLLYFEKLRLVEAAAEADDDRTALFDTRDALAEAMGADMIAWLARLPSLWQSGNVAVVHAGADPDRPMDQQLDHTLHWGHHAFFKRPRTDGTWIVHGHTIVANPQARDGRISIDTGAYASGRLTGVRIEGGEAYAETVTLQD